jgi:hypothetical protein
MKSIYTRIVVWCSATLLFSALAAFFLSVYVSAHLGNGFSPERGFRELLEAEAVQVYESGGAAGLLAFYANARRFAGISVVLLDVQGNDLATGKPGIK